MLTNFALFQRFIKTPKMKCQANLPTLILSNYVYVRSLWLQIIYLEKICEIEQVRRQSTEPHWELYLKQIIIFNLKVFGMAALRAANSFAMVFCFIYLGSTKSSL